MGRRLGRLDEKREKFLIAYEATEGTKPDLFTVKETIPPKQDKGFFLATGRTIDVFSSGQRPWPVLITHGMGSSGMGGRSCCPTRERTFWPYSG